MRCLSICHCLGAAMGSLDTCTHVIPMPESHKIWPWSLWVCTVFLLFIPHLIRHAQTLILVLVFLPTPHIKLFMTMMKMHKKVTWKRKKKKERKRMEWSTLASFQSIPWKKKMKRKRRRIKERTLTSDCTATRWTIGLDWGWWYFSR